MSAKQFIEKLEQLGLLSTDILQELRRQVDESKAKITAGTLARLLVDNGHLTKFQATKLISEMSKDAPERQAASGKTTPDDDSLALAPEAPATKKAVILDDDEDEDDEVVAVDVVHDDEVVAVDVVDDDEVVAVEVVGDDDVVAVEVVDEATPAANSESPPKRSSKRITKIENSGVKRPKEALSSRPRSKRPLNPPSRPGDNPWGVASHLIGGRRARSVAGLCRRFGLLLFSVAMLRRCWLTPMTRTSPTTTKWL